MKCRSSSEIQRVRDSGSGDGGRRGVGVAEEWSTGDVRAIIMVREGLREREGKAGRMRERANILLNLLQTFAIRKSGKPSRQQHTY